MTSTELHDLIFNDPTAKELADAGNDGAAALRINEIASPTIEAAWCTERTVYATLGPAAGEAFLAALEFVAQSNVLTGRI